MARKKAKRPPRSAEKKVVSSAPAAFCAGVSKGLITRTQDGILLNIRVWPDAQRTAIDDPYDESAIKLRVAAPPVEGKANTEIVRFLAELLGITHSDLSVVRGASGSDKVVRVRGLGEAKIWEILSSNLR